MKAAVITPRQIMFDGETPELILPGEDGEFSVWDFHEPAVIRLKAGTVRVRQGGVVPPRYTRIPLQRGMVKVSTQEITVFIE